MQEASDNIASNIKRPDTDRLISVVSQFPIPAFKNVRMLERCSSGHPIIINLILALNNGIYPPTVAGTSSDTINQNEDKMEEVQLTHEILLPDQVKKFHRSSTTRSKSKNPVAMQEKKYERIETRNHPKPKPKSAPASNKPAILTLEQVLKEISKR